MNDPLRPEVVDRIAAWARSLELTDDALRGLVPTYAALADSIAGHRSRSGRALRVGITGGQGTGKSSLCRFLRAWSEEVHGLSVAVLSIDDLYLGRARRKELAKEVHPLYATRGVPGTHDVELGLRVLRDLEKDGELRLPRFDKATDDPVPETEWPRVRTPVDVILFEGWCVAATPEPEASLAEPINDFERTEDADGSFRRVVNRELETRYRELFGLLDLRVLLLAPSMDSVLRWRTQAEESLRAGRGREKASSACMDEAELRRFVQMFERITVHMLREAPSRADVILELDDDHRVAPRRGLDDVHDRTEFADAVCARQWTGGRGAPEPQ